MLVWTYDEGGGYYDHVPPPPGGQARRRAAHVGRHRPARAVFNRYGFRVPSGIVSPYARKDYASHVVHDFTSILKLVETKWNLPALTYRDAAADNLLDSIDLAAPPAFLTPPALAAPIDPALAERCLTKGPGTIPPRRYVTTR